MDCFLLSDCAPEKYIRYLCIHNHYEQEGYGVKRLTVTVQSNPWHSRNMNMTAFLVLYWCWNVGRPILEELCEFCIHNILQETNSGRKLPSLIWDEIENDIFPNLLWKQYGKQKAIRCVYAFPYIHTSKK